MAGLSDFQATGTSLTDIMQSDDHLPSPRLWSRGGVLLVAATLSLQRDGPSTNQRDIHYLDHFQALTVCRA